MQKIYNRLLITCIMVALAPALFAQAPNPAKKQVKSPGNGEEQSRLSFVVSPEGKIYAVPSALGGNTSVEKAQQEALQNRTYRKCHVQYSYPVNNSGTDIVTFRNSGLRATSLQRTESKQVIF